MSVTQALLLYNFIVSSHAHLELPHAEVLSLTWVPGDAGGVDGHAELAVRAAPTQIVWVVTVCRSGGCCRGKYKSCSLNR